MVASYPIIDAFLYIDGKHRGQTPAKITVKPGKYKLKAEKEGWIGEEKEVIVKEGEGCIFVNIFMRREEEKKTEERRQRTEDRRQTTDIQTTENREQKIEPQREEELPKIAEIPKEEPPKIAEVPKIEPEVRAKEQPTSILLAPEIIQK
ncbi:MAG: PEGA domain-containing protein, partial [bacterium]